MFECMFFITRKSQCIPGLLKKTDKCAPENLFDKNFRTITPDRSEWDNPKQQDTLTFTGGSKIDSGSGTGKYSVIQSMELSDPLRK